MDSNELQDKIIRIENNLRSGKPVYIDLVEAYDILEEFIDADKFNIALKCIDSIIAQHGEIEDILCRKAEVLIFKNNIAPALKILDSIGKNISDKNFYFFQYARAYSHQKKTIPLAFDYLEKSIANIPDDRVLATTIIAEILFAKSFFNEAIQLFKILEEKGSFDFDATELYVSCLIKENREEEAILQLKNHLKKEPYNEHAWLYLAALYFDNGKNEEAINTCDFLLAFANNNTATYIKAHALFKLKKHEESLEFCNKILQNDSYDIKTLLLSIDCNEELKNYQAAIDIAEFLLPMVPDSHFLLFRLGQLYLYNRAYKTAEKYLAEAVELFSDDYTYWQLLGLACSMNNKWRKSEKAFLQSIRLNPRDSETWLFLITHYKQYDKTELAIKTIQKAIEKNIQHPAIFYIYSALLANNSELKESEKYYKKAYKLDKGEHEKYFYTFCTITLNTLTFLNI